MSARGACQYVGSLLCCAPHVDRKGQRPAGGPIERLPRGSFFSTVKRQEAGCAQPSWCVSSPHSSLPSPSHQVAGLRPCAAAVSAMQGELLELCRARPRRQAGATVPCGFVGACWLPRPQLQHRAFFKAQQCPPATGGFRAVATAGPSVAAWATTRGDQQPTGRFGTKSGHHWSLFTALSGRHHSERTYLCLGRCGPRAAVCRALLLPQRKSVGLFRQPACGRFQVRGCSPGRVARSDWSLLVLEQLRASRLCWENRPDGLN